MQLKDGARRLPEEIWTVFEPLLPPVIWCGDGRPPVGSRECFHALLYVLVSGISWEMLPTGFPPYKTVQRRPRRWLECDAFLIAWRRLAERYERLDGINWDQVLIDGSITFARPPARPTRPIVTPKVLLKKVRGIRPIERAVEGRDDDEARAIRGYCAAVRTSAGEGRRGPGRGRRQEGLPRELTRLRAILGKGLAATESARPEVRTAFGWVHRAAAILRNKRGLDSAGVRRCLRGLMGAIARHHFLKVTRSYWAGLFACYDLAGLPRTSNGLEQLFGSYRHHERRAGGGRWPRRGWWCAGRCCWPRRPRRGSGRSVPPTCRRRTSGRGGCSAVRWSGGRRSVAGPPLPPRPGGLLAVAQGLPYQENSAVLVFSLRRDLTRFDEPIHRAR